MDMKSGQRSPVCAESCEMQRMEVTDRAPPGLTPPFILVTEIPCCLQACFVFSLHAHHLFHLILVLKIILLSWESVGDTGKETVGIVLKLPLC